MATKQQIAKVSATIVEFQEEFELLSTADRQWIIQNGKDSVSLFVKAVADRAKSKKEKIENELAGIFIDCDADPFLPNEWSVETHQKGGRFKFNSTKISLYLSKKQSKGKMVIGNNFRKELVDKSVMNANVLDYLLAHPELIPESWKDKKIFFWGTVYYNASGGLCIRYLYWNGSEWSWLSYWLDYFFGSDNPAALTS